MQRVKLMSLMVTIFFLLPRIALGGQEGMEFLEAKVDYSADRYMESGKHKVQGKIYGSPGKERQEMMSAMEGMGIIMITRHDKGVRWNLMSMRNSYTESPLDKNSNSFNVSEHSVVGEETIDGHATTKHKVIMTMPEGKFGGFMWVTKEGILVKMDAIQKKADGTTYRMTQWIENLKIAKQDPALFEIPKGYAKTSGGMGIGAMTSGLIPGLRLQAPSGSPGDAADDEGRSYSAQPRRERNVPGLDSVITNPVKSLKGLFGR